MLISLAYVCLIASVSGQVSPPLSTGILPSLFVHGDHFSVGQQIGYTTRSSILYRLRRSESVMQLVQWVSSTPEGQAAYDAMLTTANNTFPEYVSELEGMAYGSGVNFETLFVLNVRNELKTFKKASQHLRGDTIKEKPEVEHCSDYLMNALSGSTADGVNEIVIGHNEDGGWESRDESWLITAHMEGEGVRENIRYTSFVYAGELPTDAFFWNEHGVVGTMNGLYPVECLYGGLGRNFISRHLVGAVDIDDAISRVTIPNQATGHSFNFASKHEQRLVNVEVAPGVHEKDKASLYVVTRIEQSLDVETATSLFHANSYLFLDVEQDPSDSSAHRIARAAELPPPQCVQDILTVLGDTKDEEWPIYRTATSEEESDSGYTLTTALFSIVFENEKYSEKSSLTLYMSNPKTDQHVRLDKKLFVE
eukprot:CAMPEP_0185025902 /NCGR_PEP_ID=MMETSP1103-20130426/9447_1 /TAXON_ID=36769 /ORGANISM="Paraphysomonas bandaiensis, Strain Caron Lab Isolate" /LENGTH=422 /DNA_ID=CAMNT_0027559289 /DNA_START=27 /DNA_END=1295 /DNA_ORIENTATION=+